MPSETLFEAYPSLYSRIEKVAPTMNGQFHCEPLINGYIPILTIEIPEGLHVEFAQSPVSTRHVIARRKFNGKRKTDWTLELRDGTWQGPKGDLLSDEDIKTCLTYDGIEPAFF
ncbi:hypothetical protein FTO74_04775 [Granulicella sp. WH15]|uniref:hypothetical protein n=1 Tax=Granulicella sp. WH15 TaxID=2602070 RepID=UPI0013668B49|nr:hypothetical protein [Granulicella sp. WH15]QHN02759.1 hypothetical protein FTO74_04775 [Granulicella sp. WH15]